MVRAEIAGCGKSFACKAMKARGHKALFVRPTNKLAKNIILKTVLPDEILFGWGMTDDLARRIATCDDSFYDVIVFDEIYFASVNVLAKTVRDIGSKPNKISLATGGAKQLEIIDLVSNQTDYETYMDHCINTVFLNSITLHEINA